MKYFIGILLLVSLNINAANRIGEVGFKTLFATNEWKTLSFQGTYTNPVVVIGAPSYFGAEQCVVRIRNISSNSCSVRLQEVTNLNGIHTHETIYYMVVEKGDWILKGGLHLQAGKTNISDTVGTRVGNTFAHIPFYSSFNSTPSFISSVLTFNDTNFVKTRHNKATLSGCSIALEEDENSTHIHGTETIGWIAIEKKIGSHYTNLFEIDATSDSVTHTFYEQTFSQSFSSSPIVLAQMSSYDGPNNAETRVSNISSSSFFVKIEEDTTYDSEVNHTTEVVDYFAFQYSGFLYSIPNNYLSVSRGIYSPSGYLHSYSAVQPVLQLKIVSMSTETITNLQITFTASGSGNDSSSVIPLVSVYSDTNKNGFLDSSEGLIGTNTFSGDNGFMTLHFGNIVSFSTNYFLITYDVGGAYNNDTFRLSAEDTNIFAYGDNTGQRLDIMESSVESYLLTVQTPQGIGIGEVGVLSKWVDENWATVMMRKKYTSPVIVAMPVSDNEYDPVATRIRNVTSSNFQIRLQEPINEDGTHTKETVSYIVMEEGQFTMPGNKIIIAGKYNTTTTCGDNDPGNHFDTVNFGYTFSAIPTVLHQVMTYNDSYFATTRADGSTTSSFRVALEEDQGATGNHGSETIGWIAIQTGVGTNNGIHYETGRTSDSVTENWYTINFSSSFNAPSVFLSSLETYDGSDAAWMRYDSLSVNSAVIKVEEDRNGDTEQNHTTERVDYAVFESFGDLLGVTNTPSAHLFVKCTNFITNMYWEENQGPEKILRFIFQNTNQLGNQMEVDTITLKLSDKLNNNIVPSTAIKKIRVVHFNTNRPILIQTNVPTTGTEISIDLTPSPIYISNVSFATSEIYVYVASNVIATNLQFTLESTNKILSYDAFFHTALTNHPFPSFSFPYSTSNVDLISFFHISHDTLADVGAWEPIHIEIQNYNHTLITNFSGTLNLNTINSTTNTIEWTNYAGNGIFSNVSGSDNCVYEFSLLDKGVVDLYVKDSTEETISIQAYDMWMSDISNNLRIGQPKLVISKTSFFSNSTSYTQIALSNHSLVPGTKMTYQIVCSNAGLTSALDVHISDTLLTNQIYISNSLFLDTKNLTDVLDSDEGDYNVSLPNGIMVILTNLASKQKATITFSVIIK